MFSAVSAYHEFDKQIYYWFFDKILIASFNARPYTVFLQLLNNRRSVVLRLLLAENWLLRFNVGTSYPVIKDEDVLNMPIPILGDDIKQDVVAKVNESASLRRQSKQLLEYAKQAVEMAIEQGEDIALAWLKSKVEQ